MCQEVQKCFQSGTSVEVCREGEKDANAIESKQTQALAVCHDSRKPLSVTNVAIKDHQI